jgi:fructokinase
MPAMLIKNDTMRKVYAIGETVLDIIFKENQVQDARPGGAMLNSAVSLGRAGINVSLITEFANDQVGKHVDSFLFQSNVNTRNIYRHNDGKTAIAMAFLNEKNDATYVFYKDHPDKRLQIELPDFNHEDILLFGSFYGIEPSVREVLIRIIYAAKQKGCMIIYDPNFRKPHAHELEKLRPYILENIEMADVIRGSDEDFKIIFNADTIEKVRGIIGKKVPGIIMTKSSTAVYVSTHKVNTHFPVQKIKPLSTIGAGDNFNAGIIFGMIKENIYPQDLSTLESGIWGKIISNGVAFASDVCMSYENYISPALAERLKTEIGQ